MKREIKFRFWQHDNDGNGIMYSFDDIKKFDEPQLTLGDYIISPNRNKDIILMQFTALKDKNGKEIYEGDFLKCEQLEFVVEWNKDIAGFSFTDINDGSDLIASTCSIGEVVGNIYEK